MKLIKILMLFVWVALIGTELVSFHSPRINLDGSFKILAHITNPVAYPFLKYITPRRFVLVGGVAVAWYFAFRYLATREYLQQGLKSVEEYHNQKEQDKINQLHGVSQAQDELSRGVLETLGEREQKTEDKLVGLKKLVMENHDKNRDFYSRANSELHFVDELSDKYKVAVNETYCVAQDLIKKIAAPQAELRPSGRAGSELKPSEERRSWASVVFSECRIS